MKWQAGTTRLRMVKPMDKFERRLIEDAELIKAELSLEMQKRIQASVESTMPEKPTAPGKQPSGLGLWWASSLSGLAAAALLIAIVNWNSTVEPVENSPATAPSAWLLQGGIPLNTETADWAAPLEEELKNLQSDLEKARENVERDLRISF